MHEDGKSVSETFIFLLSVVSTKQLYHLGTKKVKNKDSTIDFEQSRKLKINVLKSYEPF